MQQFCVSLSAEKLFPNLNEAENCKILLGLTPRLQLFIKEITLVCQGLILVNFFYVIIFSRSFINADCFTLRIGPDDTF